MKSTGTPQTCKKLLLYSNMILQLKLPPSFPRVSMKARELYLKILLNTGLPWWSSVKTLPANAGDMSSTPGLERSHIPYPRAAKPACHNSCSHVPTAHAPQHKKPPQPEAQSPQQRVAPTCCIWGEGNGTPLQYCCLENPMDRGAWWAAVHGSLRVRHDWATSLSLFTFTHWRRKWQPTPVFLPGESQGRGSLVGCRLWGCTESDMTEVTAGAPRESPHSN